MRTTAADYPRKIIDHKGLTYTFVRVLPGVEAEYRNDNDAGDVQRVSIVLARQLAY